MSLASRLRRALGAPSLLAASLAALACSSPAPLPGGPPPVFEPGRELSLPGEGAPASAPPPAPEAPPAPPPSGPAPGASSAAPPSSAAPAGSAGSGSTWTSTDVEAAPVPAGAGDPVPADGRVGAKHLLVAYQGARQAAASVTRSRDDARKRAAECLAKARAPGAAFEKVVTECTDEPHGAKRGGDLYTFRPADMVPEFARGVLDTKVGQLSGVVESPFGFHVILRTK